MVLYFCHGLLVQSQVFSGVCPSLFDLLSEGFPFLLNNHQFLLQTNHLLFKHFFVGGHFLCEKGHS